MFHPTFSGIYFRTKDFKIQFHGAKLEHDKYHWRHIPVYFILASAILTCETPKNLRMILNKPNATYRVIFHTYQGKKCGADWDIFASVI
jgi:hypothetical protein